MWSPLAPSAGHGRRGFKESIMRVPLCEVCHQQEPVVWLFMADEDDVVACPTCWARMEDERPSDIEDVVTYVEVQA